MTGPTRKADRITSLDILRGFALLGILIMNIQSMAMVSDAYTDPTAMMDLNGINYWIWALGHIFADMKFMAIFSMLFGAGVVLFAESCEARGQRVWPLHYARTFWLLVFGLLHAFFIWYGDILVTYAIMGFIVVWVRRWSPMALTLMGVVLLCIPAGLLAAIGLLPADEILKIAREITSTPNEIAQEIAAYRGTWSEARSYRTGSYLEFFLDAVGYYLMWRAGGLMLIGMALYKWGVLSAKVPTRRYVLLAVAGFGIGLPLCVYSAVFQTQVGWDPVQSQFGPAVQLNYFGSVGMALGYIALILLWVQSGIWTAFRARLAAVGQMAFTNYILHSVIGTFVFYGFGLGLFGYVERWQQVLIVFAIWALQLWASPWWLERYRFGPLEWLWRSLTYRKLQPLRR